MMNRRTVLSCAAALSMVAAASAQAALFEQLPNYANAYFSDSTGPFATQRIADNFVLGSSATIGSVDYWGVYFPNNIQSDSFQIDIYADAFGQPGTLLYSGAPSALVAVDSGVDAFGVDVYEYTATLATPFAAGAGIQYWIGITNATNLGSSWGWVTANGVDSNGSYSLDAGGTWNQLGSSSAFRLNEVPAPASFGLVGLAGLGALRRRR